MDGIPAASPTDGNPTTVSHGPGLLALYFTLVLFVLLIRCWPECKPRGNPDVEAQLHLTHQSNRPTHHDHGHHNVHYQMGLGSFPYHFVDTPETNVQWPRRVDEGRIKEIAAVCTECAICLGEYADDEWGVSHRTLKPCGHRFHRLCIDPWLDTEQRRCPICRAVPHESSFEIVHAIH